MPPGVGYGLALHVNLPPPEKPVSPRRPARPAVLVVGASRFCAALEAAGLEVREARERAGVEPSAESDLDPGADPEVHVVLLEAARVPKEEDLRRTLERGVPVFVLLARADREQRLAGLRAGAYDVSDADGDPDELALRVARVARLVLAKDEARVDADRMGRLLDDRAREHERRTRELLENAAIVAVTLDLEGRVTFANRTALEILGRAWPEVEGRPWFDVAVPVGARASTVAAFRSLLAGATGPRLHENPLIGADGQERLIEWSNSLLHDAEGRVEGTASVGREVTAERRAHAQMRVADVAIDIAEIGISFVDLEGTLTRVNRAFLDLWGIEHATDALGRHASEFWESVSEAQEILARMPLTSRVDTELVAKTARGPRIVRLRGSLIRDADGEPRGGMGTFHDVTDLRRAEARFLEAQRIAHVGSWEWNHESDTAYWSDEVFRIFRVDPATFVPSLARFMDLVHETDQLQIERAIDQAYATGTCELDHRIHCGDGTTRWVHEKAEVQKDSQGRTVGLVGTVQDITDHKRLEEQLAASQKIEAVGRLAGGVAHDFHNLLTVISSAGHLIEGTGQLTGESTDDLRQIIDAADRAAKLTQQLLAFGRRQVLAPTSLDVNEVLLSIKQMLRRVIGEDVAVRMCLSKDVPRVLADRTQLEQVLMNLIVNARDAMPTGGTLTLRTGRSHVTEPEPGSPLQPGEYVSVEVVDTGIGMDAEVQARIFQPFFTTKEQGMGTGLGLATCYGIVHQSGGAIEVRSELGRGSSFTVVLPFSPAGVRERASARDLLAPSALGTQRILLVEDDPQVRVIATRCLEQAGFSVVTAADGLEGLDHLRHADHGIALVLTDVVMPSMSGADFARRARLELGARVPFVFMTGYTDDTALRYGIEAGGASIVRKPFTPDVIVREVCRVLGSVDGTERDAGQGGSSPLSEGSCTAPGPRGPRK